MWMYMGARMANAVVGMEREKLVKVKRVKRIVSFTERGYRALEAYGMSRGRSVSSLVRDAVEEYLERRVS